MHDGPAADVECDRCLAVILPGDFVCAQCGAARPEVEQPAMPQVGVGVPDASPPIAPTKRGRGKAGVKRTKALCNEQGPCPATVGPVAAADDLRPPSPRPNADMKPARSALRSGTSTGHDARRIQFSDDTHVVQVESYKDALLWWRPSDLGKAQKVTDKDIVLVNRPRGRPHKKDDQLLPGGHAPSVQPPPEAPSSSAQLPPRALLSAQPLPRAPVKPPPRTSAPVASAPPPPRALSSLDDPDVDPMEQLEDAELPRPPEPQMTMGQKRLAAVLERVRAKSRTGVG